MMIEILSIFLCFSVKDVVESSLQATLSRTSPPVAIGWHEIPSAFQPLGTIRKRRPRQVAIPQHGTRSIAQHLLVPPHAAQRQHARLSRCSDGGFRIPKRSRRGRSDGCFHARKPPKLRAGRQTIGGDFQRRQQATRR